MQNKQPSLLTRDDTFFGICEGLGEDLGVHSNFLRLALAGMLFWNPAAAVGTYAAAGVIVLLSRLIAPNPSPAFALASGSAAEAVAQEQAENGADREPVLLAA